MMLSNAPPSYSSFPAHAARRQTFSGSPPSAKQIMPPAAFAPPMMTARPAAATSQPRPAASFAAPAMMSHAATPAAATSQPRPAASFAAPATMSHAATPAAATSQPRPAASFAAPATMSHAATPAAATGQPRPAASATAPAITSAAVTPPARPGLAYGGMYNDQPLNVMLSHKPSVIPFSTGLPQSGASFDKDALTVAQAGTYQLSYELTLRPDLSVDLAVDALANGQALPTAKISRYAGIGRTVSLAHSTLVTLPAGAQLTMRLSADNEVKAHIELSQLTLVKAG